MTVANLLHLCADSHARALAAVAACNARTMIDDACWEHGAAAGRHAAPPRAAQLHSPLRARAGAVAAAARTRAHEHVNDIVVEEDEGRIVAFAAVCRPTIGGHPERLLEVDVERALHLLGERKVIDALSGRALPYRNVLAELAEEYGLNGNGAGDEQAVD